MDEIPSLTGGVDVLSTGLTHPHAGSLHWDDAEGSREGMPLAREKPYMKEIYSWVPWFKELTQKIAVGGEGYLIDRAKRVAWKEDGSEAALLNYGDANIDPLSFLYTLASLSKGRDSRNRVYQSISSEFEVTAALDPDLDDGFIFPTPPGINTLFHSRGSGDPELLWRLFRDAQASFGYVRPDVFEGALDLGNVATTKLTQTLFLVNPEEFLPIDEHTKSLGLFDSIPKRIGLAEYESLIQRVREAFPGCRPYEANLFSYLQSSEELHVDAGRCFLISTNVYDDRNDHWEQFEGGNWVYTGGPGDKRKYPLTEAKRGDIVLVRFGRNEGRGIAVVYRNDYREEFDDSHRMHVLWLNKEHASLPEMTSMIGFGRAAKSVSSFRRTLEYAPTFALLDRLMAEESTESDGVAEDVPGGTDVPLNRILYGPPGTGKTWRTRDLSLEILGETSGDWQHDRGVFEDLRFDPETGTGQVAMVTFHQNVAYEDFIEGIRPILGEEGTLRYEMRPGIFRRLVEEAKKRWPERFVLIIDEINRGNISKIFGELITLMEDSRRIGRADATSVTLPYSRDKFEIPDNLYVIGTMNTADRSIQLLDTALRRRFAFIEMMPDAEHESISRNIDGIDCTKLLKVMNERIAVLLDREHQIGHTYLLEVDTIDKLSDAMRNRIFPLLQEYFFDDWAKIRAVLGGNAFVTVEEVQELRTDPDMPEETRRVYDRLPFGDPAWEDPGQYRRIYEEGTEQEAADS